MTECRDKNIKAIQKNCDCLLKSIKYLFVVLLGLTQKLFGNVNLRHFSNVIDGKHVNK